MSEILDSGNRRHYESGAVRDIQTGKGRCDLMPLETVSFLAPEEYRRIFSSLGQFIYCRLGEYLITAILDFMKIRGWDFATAMLEVSIHYEQGAAKYGERNWEKGLPVTCYIDSAIRHLLKYIRGDSDEPHDRAFVWNLLCCMWTLEHGFITSEPQEVSNNESTVGPNPSASPITNPITNNSIGVCERFEASKIDCDL